MKPFACDDIMMDTSMASTIVSTTSSSHCHHHHRHHHRRRASHHEKGAIRRTVIFDLDVVEIQAHTEMSLEGEEDELWYSEIEEKAMMHGALKLAADLRPEDSLARGLEYHTGEGFFRCQTNRDRAIDAVLREQARQQQKGTDEQLLREVLERISKPCQDEATARGRLDEAEAFPQWHTKLPRDTNEEFEYLNHNRKINFFNKVSRFFGE